MRKFSKLLYFSGAAIVLRKVLLELADNRGYPLSHRNIAFQKATVIKYTLDMAKAAAGEKKQECNFPYAVIIINEEMIIILL